MKKKIALLILTLVALTAILTACNSAATTIVVRWNESEDYTFNISLADFDTSENATGFLKIFIRKCNLLQRFSHIGSRSRQFNDSRRASSGKCRRDVYLFFKAFFGHKPRRGNRKANFVRSI